MVEAELRAGGERPDHAGDRLAADLVGRRPDLTAARLRAESAARRIDVARAGFYPNLNLAAFTGVNARASTC